MKSTFSDSDTSCSHEDIALLTLKLTTVIDQRAVAISTWPTTTAINDNVSLMPSPEMECVTPTPPATLRASMPFCPSFRKQHYKEVPSPVKDHCHLLPYRTEALDAYYTLGKELGQGQFGVVRECISKQTGKSFACKTLAKERFQTPNELSDVLREIKLLKLLRNRRSVVSLQGVFEDSKSVHIVTDICVGGELYEVLADRLHFSEQEAASLFRDLVAAVADCHGAGVLHRDLKPENILLTKQFGEEGCEIKLADFGLALQLRPGQKTEGVAGSPLYIAPETLEQAYDFAADVWSLGVILYIFICGSAPFHGETDLETVQLAGSAPLDFSDPLWLTVHPSAMGLVRMCLNKEPERRPTAADILRHPWLCAAGPDVLFADVCTSAAEKNPDPRVFLDRWTGGEASPDLVFTFQNLIAEGGGMWSSIFRNEMPLLPADVAHMRCDSDSSETGVGVREGVQCIGSPRSPFELWESTPY